VDEYRRGAGYHIVRVEVGYCEVAGAYLADYYLSG
jgi:hypothetical protein